MNLPSRQLSSEVRQLLFIAVSATTAVVLSYGYVTTAGLPEMVFAIVGAGLLLALLVILPVILLD
ncbi:hypothetical protein ACODNH_20420 (plasmid) [Haloarcula sp. NS06]|uniref:hypothetical protein n=1 Tax=Haloarcula sp. NS06 TaxID=3409688 RepID=UPI003DA6FBA4